jgi:uncharacterized coiled-coil protein SlyX
MLRLCRTVALVLLLPAYLLAQSKLEKVELEDGRTHIGRVVEEQDQLIISSDGARIAVSKSDVRDRIDLVAEYESRIQAIDSRYAEQLVKAAQWCIENKLRDQADLLISRALDVEPDSQEAKDIADSLLESEEKSAVTVARKGPTPVAPPPGRVSKSDVQRIRLLELDLRDGGRDARISVNIKRSLIDEFLKEMQSTREEYTDRVQRGAFRRLRGFNQLLRMASADGEGPLDLAKFAPRVRIRRDPAVMVEFRRSVQSMVLRSCATSGCHGGREARGFRLHTRGIGNVQNTYANFAVLDGYETTRIAGSREFLGRPATAKIIDREHPEDSLLLHYGLPSGATETPHPPASGKPIRPMFRRMGDERYQKVLSWVRLLRKPGPDYELEWTETKVPLRNVSKRQRERRP